MASDRLSKIDTFYRATSHGVRRAMLRALLNAEEGLSAGALGEITKLEDSDRLIHSKVLRESGLVARVRDKQRQIYSLTEEGRKFVAANAEFLGE